MPNLKSIIVERVEDHNFHDIKITSFTGIRPKDKEICEDLPGQNLIEYYSSENFSVEGQDYSINLYEIQVK